jgi:hypothetical protein
LSDKMTSLEHFDIYFVVCVTFSQYVIIFFDIDRLVDHDFVNCLPKHFVLSVFKDLEAPLGMNRTNVRGIFSYPPPPSLKYICFNMATGRIRGRAKYSDVVWEGFARQAKPIMRASNNYPNSRS